MNCMDQLSAGGDARIRVRVRLFGALRDFHAKDELSLELVPGESVCRLRERLSGQLEPEAREVLLDSAFASETEILSEGHTFVRDSAVAVIPPVCGG